MNSSFWSKLLMTSTTFALVLVPGLAQAAEGESGGAMNGLSFLAVALGAGLAALGGTLGQSRAASAALEGITRNPNASNKVFVPLLLSLALIESLVLVTWVLMNTMLSKI